jgi:hypothetical protein
MNVNDFFLDLWADLREKRLWPVAVLLLVGLIAVPVVLSKPNEDAPTLPAPSATQAEEANEVKGLAALTVAEDRTGEGSTLDVFDPSDPFKPPQDVIAAAEESEGAGPTTDAGTGGATADTGAASGGAPSGGIDTGGDTGTGTGDDDGDGDGGGDDDGGGEPTTVEYRYVIDVTFVANGRKRRIKGMERLDILPRESNPLLIFLGASSNGGNAVFLVDSTLEAAGEGKCKPSDADCAFVHIGPGSEHEFTNEQGDSYTLRIDQIRRVKVEGSSASDGGESGGESAEGASANAAFEGETASRRFVPPLITDFVTVSGGSDENLSDGDQSGR